MSQDRYTCVKGTGDRKIEGQGDKGQGDRRQGKQRDGTGAGTGDREIKNRLQGEVDM